MKVLGRKRLEPYQSYNTRMNNLHALPRGLWKLGQIQEVLTGRDSLPWAALVRVASRDCQHVLLRKPLQLLYPLEIHEAEMLEIGSEDAPASVPDVRISAPVEEPDS